MPETEDQRRERALALAEKRGGEMAKIDARLAEHDRHLEAINGSIGETARGLQQVRSEVNDLRSEFRQSIAIAADRASMAKEAAEAQVSTRTFVLGLVGAVAAIGGLLSATGHA